MTGELSDLILTLEKSTCNSLLQKKQTEHQILYTIGYPGYKARGQYNQDYRNSPYLRWLSINCIIKSRSIYVPCTQVFS